MTSVKSFPHLASSALEPFGYRAESLTRASRIQLTPARDGRLDLRIDGRVALRDMVPEFAVRAAALVCKVRSQLPSDGNPSRTLIHHGEALCPTT